jgi:hypothetical protein
VSVPYRLGTLTYKSQVKTSYRVCIHTLSRVLWLQISPPDWGGLQRCHMSYDSGPQLPAEVGSDAAMSPMAPDLASRLRWASALPRIHWLWTSPLGWGELQRYHMPYGLRPRLPTEVGSGVATCPMAPNVAPGWGRLRRCHVPYGSRPHMLAGVGSSAATCPMAPDQASRQRWAPALPRVPRVPLGREIQA